jgi:hypothetical protein
MKNVSDTICGEKQNTYIQYRFQKIVPLRDNLEKIEGGRQATDNNVTRSKRFTCWITKATDTHSCTATAQSV